MIKKLTYLTLLTLVFSCAEAVELDTAKAVVADSLDVSSDQKVATDPHPGTSELVAKDCLMKSDTADVVRFIEDMKTYIQNGDDPAIQSKIKVSDEYMHDPIADLVGYVKDYFVVDLVSPSEKSELESSSRFYMKEDDPCGNYLITRNFVESEFSLVFFLAKYDGEIIISRIELAG